MGGVSGFLLLNRYATDNRDRNAAKELCQERLEQMLVLPFNPKAGVVPTVVGQDGVTYYLLGKTTNYDAANNYTGGANLQTSSEAVTVSLQPNGTATAATPVTGTRTTTISTASSTTAGLCLVQVSVTVTWVVRGTSNTYTLYALRSADY